MAQIKNRFTDEVIAEGDTVHEAAENNRANLDRANLDWARLNGANLDSANLDWANLDRANLDGANLNRASLNGAKGVVMSGTSPRGYSHWAWIKSGAIVYRAGCREFHSADDYRAFYSAAGYAESHGALSAAVSLALCEMNIDLAGKLLDKKSWT